ncbi:hypothetical protein F0562_012739 [Nyssa sinensis]|uniref:F-box domain-containing protein n=1 Tax=Nyssa sinensis TaxID=561372 RepID=A0A5J4ZY20_9ASTE|nr:hypothetical protein F0562_012739 [Nyssa sinensis]
MARIKRSTGMKPEIMAKNMKSNSEKWNAIQYDVLLKIFATFNIMDVILRFSTVCRSWRLVCSDPVLWKSHTIDLSALSNYFHAPPIPSVWSQVVSAGRCPHVKKLVLSASNIISMKGFIMAIHNLKGLESMMVPCINSPYYIMKLIGQYCKNFSELKVMSPFDLDFATSITTFLPRLKVLSLRCAIVHKNALEHILDNLKHLEVLSISHCLFIYVSPRTNKPKYVYLNLCPILLQKATSRLREFYTCEKRSCIMCNRNFADDDGALEWHEYDDEVWRVDEVTSLGY